MSTPFVLSDRLTFAPIPPRSTRMYKLVESEMSSPKQRFVILDSLFFTAAGTALHFFESFMIHVHYLIHERTMARQTLRTGMVEYVL
jgi:hypothetical protein